MKPTWICFSLLITLVCGCSTTPTSSNADSFPERTSNVSTLPAARPVNNLEAIFAKREVPVLCYHHIRPARRGESESMKTYSVSPEAFASQMKKLADSGFQSILPDQLRDYLLYDQPLPDKPVMITFDDTDGEQCTIGAKEMDKHGFKGVFFIMTISMNRPRYMSKEQIKQLSDSGHVIAGHTWDHHMVTKYEGADWDMQLLKSKQQLEEITGKKVTYFAYPFGLWNHTPIPEIKKRGYEMAFILSTRRDSTEPLHTIRRMIVPGTWSPNGMLKAMRSTFNKNQINPGL